MTNFRYSARFSILAKLNYDCHDLGATGGGGGGVLPPSGIRGSFPVVVPVLPSGLECTLTTALLTSVNMQKSFLLPQVVNVNDVNRIVSVTDLLKGGKRILNPLSLFMNLDVSNSLNNAPNMPICNVKNSDNMLIISDLTEFELSPGVYDFATYVYPIDGDIYVENRKVTQYLFYYEKN